MNIMSALVIAASLFGSWQPPEKVLDKQFWMNVPDSDDMNDPEMRPVFLNSGHLEKACVQFFSGEAT